MCHKTMWRCSSGGMRRSRSKPSQATLTWLRLFMHSVYSEVILHHSAPGAPEGSAGTPHSHGSLGNGEGPRLPPRRAGPRVLTGLVPTDHQSTWLCPLAQLPFLRGSRLTPDTSAVVGVWRAIAGGF